MHISDLEHNSVLRPLNKLKTTIGITYSVYNSDLPTDEAITPLITESTTCIISTLASNVTGKTINPYELSDIAKRFNLKLIFDASQYAGHRKIDIEKCPCDAICSAGHKALFGIQGSGFLYLNDIDNTDTIIEGGTGSASMNLTMPEHLPDKFEPGTLSSPSVISLGIGSKYISDIGLENIEKRLDYLTQTLKDILSNFKGIKIYGAQNGIISFNIYNLPSQTTASLFAKDGIAVRGGFHCAPLIHEKLNTLKQGAVRISFSYFNNKCDLDKVFKCIKGVYRL